MSTCPLILHWPDPDATARCAVALGHSLRPGDVILLGGQVGAGKTHFARALIQSLLITPEDVPSPTFTLVQTYDTQSGPLWHADLYRVSVDSEVDELGLLDAFEEAICLIEWPDRMGSLTPKDALSIEIAPEGEGRIARITWSDSKWQARLAGVVQHA